MSLTVSPIGLEGRLSELADRLVRQEETTRRLEATLHALARFPDEAAGRPTANEELILTPRTVPARTPIDVRWPAKRSVPVPRAEPAVDPDPDTTDTDVLWAAAGFIPDPFVGLDAAGRVRVWNPAAEVAFGWPAPDVIGFPPPFLPDDKWAEHTQLLSAACHGDPVRDVATIRRRKDGSLVRVMVSAAGHKGGAAFVVKPDSAAESNTPLRPALHPIAGSSDGDSTDTVAAVKRVITAVVHDLNNLFTVICGGTESLIERHTPGDPRRADVEMVHAAGLHASRLVRQLADLTVDGQIPSTRADLNAVIREMAPVLRGVLGATRELIVDAAAPVATVTADPARISQVLLNLTANARDAMPAGGAVYVSTGLDESARVVLTVRDTGPGVDPVVRGRMFERNVSTKSGHNGVGLATVADVMDQAGGTIAVESAPGHGTAIILTLPQADAVEITAAAF